MRKNKLVNLSPKPASKCEHLLERGRKIANSLSNNPRISPKSMSPSNFIKNQRIKAANIPQIEDYRNSTMLILSDDRQKQIDKRLSIQAETLISLQRRFKLQNFYLDTTDNPITRQFKAVKHKEKQQGKKTQKLKKPNIFEQINNLKTTKIHMLNIRKRMIDLSSLEEVQNRIIKWNKTRLLEKQQKRQAGFKVHQKQITVQPVVAETVGKQKVQFEWMDQLIKTKEKSFFMLQSKTPKNIFLLLKDKNHKDFYSNRQILKKNYFDFYSTVRSDNGFVHADKISVFAREAIFNSKMQFKNLPFQLDIKISMDSIHFQEILLVASGKVNHINKFLRQGEIERKKVEQIQDHSYGAKKMIKQQERKTKDQNTNYYPSAQSQIEVQYYRALGENQIQRQQHEISKSFRLKLQELIKEELFYNERGIMDRFVIEQLKASMNQTLLGLLDCNVERSDFSVTERDLDRKIRRHKVSKDKTEITKIKECVKTMKMKKEFDSLKKKHRFLTSRAINNQKSNS